MALFFFVYLAALLAGALTVETVYLRYGDDLLIGMSAEISLNVLEGSLIDLLVAETGHIPMIEGLCKYGNGMAEGAVVVDGAANFVGDLVAHTAVVLHLGAIHFIVEGTPVNITVLEYGDLSILDCGIEIESTLNLGDLLTVSSEEAASAILLKEGVNAVQRASYLGTEDKETASVSLNGKSVVAELLLSLAAGTVTEAYNNLAIGLGSIISNDGELGIGDHFQVFCKLLCGSLFGLGVVFAVNYHIICGLVIS